LVLGAAGGHPPAQRVAAVDGIRGHGCGAVGCDVGTEGFQAVGPAVFGAGPHPPRQRLQRGDAGGGQGALVVVTAPPRHPPAQLKALMHGAGVHRGGAVLVEVGAQVGEAFGPPVSVGASPVPPRHGL